MTETASPAEIGAGPEYHAFWLQAEQALEAGRLEEARRWYAASLGAAQRQGVAELVDRAFCNEAAVAIALGEVEASIPRLREILMRNGSAMNCYLAAYSIARAYELRKDPKKSLFYARVARERAVYFDEPSRLAAAHNQIANALLADSAFAEAADTYRQALALLPGGDGNTRALICSANLAYCELILGRQRDALGRLYAVLRAARRRGWARLEMIARLDLCFAHLELGRYRSAERYGRRGRELAELVGELDWIKNALYLLGEVAVLDGRDAEGRECFGELQQRFYPDQPYLAQFLVGIDVRQVINLRA